MCSVVEEQGVAIAGRWACASDVLPCSLPSERRGGSGECACGPGNYTWAASARLCLLNPCNPCETLNPHLRAVSPLPDFRAAAATGQVQSPARGVFAALRGYPERRGEVPGAQRTLAATLGQCYQAAHALCERALKLKARRWGPLPGVAPLGRISF